MTEFSIRTRDVTTLPKMVRVTRRWWALSTEATKGAGGWVLANMPKIGDKLNISGMSWGTNEEPICVLSKVVPRGSEKRVLAFAIYQMSRAR